MKYILFTLLFNTVYVYSKPSTSSGLFDNTQSKPDKIQCCIDHIKKPIFPLEVANYDCSQLTNLGKKRCDSVYSGNVCRWVSNKKCEQKKCQRVKNYEMHFGKSIDTGKCIGLCNLNKTCSPKNHDIINVGTETNKVFIIKDCNCDDCSTIPLTTTLEVPINKCRGNCNINQYDQTCVAGIADQFSSINGIEASNPSPALISGILSSCSSGIQNGFDIFANDRCFGHTFTNCLNKGECPLKSATLQICLQAANVPLTNTDSLILGVNGNSIWGISLPNLNGGTWNQGEQLCTTLNLENLPNGGINILNTIQSVGHLDIVVQDDTSVDFLRFGVQYEQCQICVPKITSVSTYYSSNGIQDFVNSEHCDCVNNGECNREDHHISYFEGTNFETTINIGQCIGKCPQFTKCRSDEISKIKIKAPEGSREIDIIKSCQCGKFIWNPNGEFIKE